ncbi:MAG TPA: dienelactone hydrolase family protein [Xanthobacteraceae bacterium]|nr:dienelactone hydrolase family protein [Xanthobacteraceae bacterium]
MKQLATTSLLVALAVAVAQPADAADPLSKDMPARIEAIPIQTLTLSDEQFLKGDAYGRPTTIAGVLRVAQGSGRLPLVVLVPGSGGINASADVWDRQFESMGISTFMMDSFAGRGIVNTVVDQSQLGRLNMILDLYRSLTALAAHPRVDPNRIAVMGFSRGGQATLYASLKRFHKMWNPSGVDPAVYIALYPPCITTYIGDTDVSDHPIRMFHGTSDDYVEIGPCRGYFARLKATARDVQMTEYPDTWHAYDLPLLPSTPTVAQNAQTTHCVLKEEPIGTIMNSATQKQFSNTDECVGRNPHVAYSASSTHATEDAVKMLLKTVFKLN